MSTKYIQKSGILFLAMPIDQEQPREILEPHIPSGEEIEALDVRQGNVTAVTDRRILSVTESQSRREQEQEVESLLLTSSQILGTRYGKNISRNESTVQQLVGAGFAVIGVLLLPLGLIGNGSDQAVLLLSGLIAIAIGVLIFWSAEDTTEGSVFITVRRAGEIPDRTWTFPRGQTEVPQAVSEQVAQIHSQE